MSKLLLGFDNMLQEVLGYEVFGQVRTWKIRDISLGSTQVLQLLKYM
jgi:hypothetical protein